jgi:hypothetical protein
LPVMGLFSRAKVCRLPRMPSKIIFAIFGSKTRWWQCCHDENCQLSELTCLPLICYFYVQVHKEHFQKCVDVILS